MTWMEAWRDERNPCYKCPRRRPPDCHVDCAAYEAFDAKRKSDNERRLAAKRDTWFPWRIKKRR